MISRWKSELLESGSLVFTKAKSEDTKTLKAVNEKLYKEIGRQKIEIDFQKKTLRSWENKNPPRRETRLDHFGAPAMRASDGEPWPALLCTQ
jgi:hypothetical protein